MDMIKNNKVTETVSEKTVPSDLVLHLRHKLACILKNYKKEGSAGLSPSW